MSESPIYPPFDAVMAKTHVTEAQYQALYARSLRDPSGFWAEQAEKCVTWFKRWDHVVSGSMEQQDVRWFAEGKLNVSYNCLDRHLEKRAEKVAIFWEGDHPGESRRITYQMLYDDVSRFANVLKKLGNILFPLSQQV